MSDQVRKEAEEADALCKAIIDCRESDEGGNHDFCIPRDHASDALRRARAEGEAAGLDRAAKWHDERGWHETAKRIRALKPEGQP